MYISLLHYNIKNTNYIMTNNLLQFSNNSHYIIGGILFHINSINIIAQYENVQ